MKWIGSACVLSGIIQVMQCQQVENGFWLMCLMAGIIFMSLIMMQKKGIDLLNTINHLLFNPNYGADYQTDPNGNYGFNN